MFDRKRSRREVLQELRDEIVRTTKGTMKLTKTTKVLAGLCVLGGLSGSLRVGEVAFAQVIDPRQMAGIPRPVTDLPDGAVSVRLIRGDLSNNIPGHPVDLRIGTTVQTVKTDDMGRAEFRNLPAGAALKASAEVDGERLESQEFPAPARGGIRLLLVATDTSRGPATSPTAPAVTGNVVIGSGSRILLEPSEEAVQIYYVLDILNNARAPVNPATPFAFDMAGCAVASLLPGSSPLVSVDGPRVAVAGPFPPGSTPVQVACEVPAATGSVELRQIFPAALEQFAVIVKKVGNPTLMSPQIAGQQDVQAQGETFIAATGSAVAAGQPLILSVSGFPHHSRTPRFIALGLAVAIIGAGIWVLRGSGQPDDKTAADRKRLLGRRDKLFQELVRLEHDRRRGRANDARYATRREELMAALENVYGELDEQASGAVSPGVDAARPRAERAGGPGAAREAAPEAR
jgi:hypothetical protein